MEEDILIYSESTSPRLNYILKILIQERLGLRYRLTHDWSHFTAHPSPRLNYSNQELPGTFSITSSTLLFDKGVRPYSLAISHTDGLPLIFSNAQCELGFDPLAASFYFLSRFEEYLPFEADEHGRFTSEQSLSGKLKAVQIPLVDHYALMIRQALMKYNPGVKFNTREFEREVSIDVDRIFLYRNHGFVNTAASIVKDFLFLRNGLVSRIAAISRLKRDPLDIYDLLVAWCIQHHCPIQFFIQIGQRSPYDLNNPVQLQKVQQKILELSNSCEVGIHPSYKTSDSYALMQNEVQTLNRIIGKTVEHSRQHFLRFRIPETYQMLVRAGIRHDYSMAFPDANGFRAGTSIPFTFYDLVTEKETDLTVHPFAFMDLLAVRNNKSETEAITELHQLQDAVKKSIGRFSTVWHPETLVGYDVPFASMNLLRSLWT